MICKDFIEIYPHHTLAESMASEKESEEQSEKESEERSPFTELLKRTRQSFPGDNLRVSWCEPEQSMSGALYGAKVTLSVEMKVDGKWYSIDETTETYNNSAYKAIEMTKFIALSKAIKKICTISEAK